MEPGIDRGRGGLAETGSESTEAGVGSAMILGVSAFDPGHGLTQRIGLGITDLWIIATSWFMWRRRTP